MSEPIREPQVPDPGVEDAAATWLVLRDRGLTPAQQDAFLQWLAANPAHREAFERHVAMWSDFDQLSHWRPEHGTEPNPDLLARHRPSPWRRWFAPALLAAAAAVAVVVWRGSGLPSATGPVVFEAAEYRQETLPDGSVLDLNRGAHAVVQYGERERRVLLVQGEARFTVAKNPGRPFIVRASGVDVRAVGTAFNVKLGGSRIEILVTEGVVQVERQPAAGDEAAAAAPAVLAALTAGQRTVLEPQDSDSAAMVPSPVVTTPSAEEVERMLAWKPLLLDFEATPLAEVIAAFNARNAVTLELGDPSLAELPIVASIRSDNVEGFVRLLEAGNGIRAERVNARTIVLRRAP